MHSGPFDLATALDRAATGVVIVLYPDEAARAGIVDDILSLLPSGAKSTRTASLQTALRVRDRVVFLLPEDEAAAVRDLDGNRERFLEPRRSAPVILFLLRGGTGEKELADAPALASWTRGVQIDPAKIATVDVDRERDVFAEKTRMSPEQWLAAWRAGDIPADGDSLALSYRASFLERRT